MNTLARSFKVLTLLASGSLCLVSFSRMTVVNSTDTVSVLLESTLVIAFASMSASNSANRNTSERNCTLFWTTNLFTSSGVILALIRRTAFPLMTFYVKAVSVEDWSRLEVSMMPAPTALSSPLVSPLNISTRLCWCATHVCCIHAQLESCHCRVPLSWVLLHSTGLSCTGDSGTGPRCCDL